MPICAAGPYSAPSAEELAADLARMNAAAAELMRRGHHAMIGVNAALPVLAAAGHGYAHPWMMEISLALAERCDASLRLGRSPGADREMDPLAALGRRVFDRLDAIAAP